MPSEAGFHDDSGSRPVPDPTQRTVEQLVRSLTSEREYVDGQIEVLRERLSAMDRATRLLDETVNRVPTNIQTAIANLTAVQDERFASIDKQFLERDTRSEREARDNKLAVDAAFAAQEKQAVAQQESNSLAIEKSEKATTETIKTNQELAAATAQALDSRISSNTKALSDKIDDLKERVARVEAARQSAADTTHDQRATTQLALAGATILVVILVAVGTISFSRSGNSSPAEIVTVTTTTTTPAP